MGDRWADMTPRERADLIRAHFSGRISGAAICRLFNLSEDGLRAITDGADWAPEHSDDTP